MPSSGRQPILSTAKGNNKYKGVTRQARPGRSVKFLVQYRVDGVMKNFGSYDSELDAAIAYAASIDKNIPGRKTALTAASRHTLRQPRQSQSNVCQHELTVACKCGFSL